MNRTLGNIYDYDYRWRSVASGDLVLFRNSDDAVISTLKSEALVEDIFDTITKQEDVLKVKRIPHNAKIDHFALPSKIVL